MLCAHPRLHDREDKYRRPDQSRQRGIARVLELLAGVVVESAAPARRLR